MLLIKYYNEGADALTVGLIDGIFSVSIASICHVTV